MTDRPVEMLEGHKLVQDAASRALRARIRDQKASGSERPLYTYPTNGRRKLVDKPLTRPVSTTMAPQ